MINKLLEFIAKSSFEVMLAKQNSREYVQLIADNTSQSVRLKINNQPFAKKFRNLSNSLVSQGLDQLLDLPIQFTTKSNVEINGQEFEQLRQESKSITITIQPDDENSEKMLKAFGKQEPKIEISLSGIPSFTNPRI